MPRASSEILELVGRLHEGVVDDDMWSGGLDGVCELLGSSILLFAAINQVRGTFDHLVGHRMSRDALALVGGTLANPVANPWFAMAPNGPLRRPVTVSDLGGQPAFERTRIWKELYLPFQVGDSAGAVLERQPGSAEVIMMGRFLPKPAFGPAEMRAFSTIIPHVARAWRVKRALAEWRNLAGTLKYILDRLDRAVLVAGPEGQVRFANRAADRLLSRGNAIGARQGRIRATRSYHDEALRSLIDRASRTSVGAASAAVDAVSIPCADDGPSLAVVAEPLAPGHSECLGHLPNPGAILFISDSEAANRPPVDRLRIVYGLTAAEARLTSLIVQDHDVADAARVLGVSKNTVKFHLKTIFDKIGVTRQAQLIRRVLADVGGLAEPETMRPASPE